MSSKLQTGIVHQFLCSHVLTFAWSVLQANFSHLLRWSFLLLQTQTRTHMKASVSRNTTIKLVVAVVVLIEITVYY